MKKMIVTIHAVLCSSVGNEPVTGSNWPWFKALNSQKYSYVILSLVTKSTKLLS